MACWQYIYTGQIHRNRETGIKKKRKQYLTALVPTGARQDGSPHEKSDHLRKHLRLNLLILRIHDVVYLHHVLAERCLVLVEAQQEVGLDGRNAQTNLCVRFTRMYLFRYHLPIGLLHCIPEIDRGKSVARHEIDREIVQRIVLGSNRRFVHRHHHMVQQSLVGGLRNASFKR